MFGKLILVPFFVVMTTQAVVADSNMRGFSSSIEEKIKKGEDFTLKVQADGSLFHKGGQVTVEFKKTDRTDKKCSRLLVQGHGKIFKEFKHDLREWARYEHNDILEDFFARSNRLQQLDVVLCSRNTPVISKETSTKETAVAVTPAEKPTTIDIDGDSDDDDDSAN